MWINRLFDTCYLKILSILLMIIKKRNSYWIDSIFHSLDSSFCKFSIKFLCSSGPRSEIILSSFMILWLYMIYNKKYILVKLTYGSKIIFFIKILQRTCLFWFSWCVINIFVTWSLLSHFFINLKPVPYHSLIYL